MFVPKNDVGFGGVNAGDEAVLFARRTAHVQVTDMVVLLWSRVVSISEITVSWEAWNSTSVA